MPEGYKSILDQYWKLRKSKRLAEAELLLHEGLAQHRPGSFDYRVLQANLADAMLQKGDLGGARETALSVLAEDPDQATALTVLGMVALSRKEYPEAIENLKKANELFPSGYRAGRLARSYELQGDFEKALAVLRQALQHNPRDGFLLRQYSKLEPKAASGASSTAAKGHQPAPVASAALEEDDYFLYAEQMRARLNDLAPSLAAAELQKVIKVGNRKDNPYLHLLLADINRRAGHEETALESYQRAHELDAQNVLALSQYLFALRRAGHREEAWPLLKELLSMRPDDVTAKSSLLKDARELNREEEAALFMEELLEKYPERKELFGAIRKLRGSTGQIGDGKDED